MMKRLHRLDEVDSDTSIGDKLRKCLELDIPVLIQVPASMDVWAIGLCCVIRTENQIARKLSDY